LSDGGRRRFDVVLLPVDTARLIELLIQEAARWGALDPESSQEREQYRMLCYARKFLSEHVEDLCDAADVDYEGRCAMRFL